MAEHTLLLEQRDTCGLLTWIAMHNATYQSPTTFSHYSLHFPSSSSTSTLKTLANSTPFSLPQKHIKKKELRNLKTNAMVKLATARDFRIYGPAGASDKWEYINAGLFLFSAIVLIGGFLAQFSSIPLHVKSGLALVLIGLIIISLVNVHDWIAHLAGIDWRVGLAEYDQQLALVEIVMPIVNAFGSMLFFVAVLFFEIEMENGYKYKLEKHGLNLLIAGSVLWLVGSIGNICQVYDRANWHIQILQKCVQVPLLLGSFLFMVGSIVNWIAKYNATNYSSKMSDKNWAWFGLFGSILFFMGGLLNLVKVFKMQQMDRSGLERLRGGARERLAREREGQVPLLEEHRTESRRNPIRKPYKDVLVESSRA